MDRETAFGMGVPAVRTPVAAVARMSALCCENNFPVSVIYIHRRATDGVETGRIRAAGCGMCGEINSAWSPNGRLCPSHRHRPEQPTPQGVGAVAAIERGDRAAIFGRVPRCLPGNKGNKTPLAVQARGGIPHTHRAPTTATTLAQVHPLLARIGRRCASFRAQNRRSRGEAARAASLAHSRACGRSR